MGGLQEEMNLNKNSVYVMVSWKKVNCDTVSH